MAKRKENSATDSLPTAVTCDVATKMDVPGGAAEASKGEPAANAVAGPPAAASDTEPPTATTPETPHGADAAAAGSDPRRQWSVTAPLAASFAFALLLSGLAGSAATIAWMRNPSPPAVDATKALQDSVAQLGTELASLKAGINSSQRASAAQLAKLGERLERAEKAQAEPVAKLTRLQESIDKLELRQQQAAASAEVTGSIAAKQESKPAPDGWKLRDFYAGRVVVESRNGTLFEVGPGANLPGLGKIESIKRDNGRVTVITSNGTLTAALEPRRPYHSMPYRY